MAMGKRRAERQSALWVPTSDLLMPPGHPFYRRLNAVLKKHGFEAFVEGLCQKFYAPVMGRASIAPGVYFRMLLVGYFEGLDSERGIAWRAADSIALRRFLGYELTEMPPDHSTLSRTRRLIDVETHDFRYQAGSWDKARRVVAKIEHHRGELFPRVGFIVTNLRRSARQVVKFCNGRGTAEQWIKHG